ncbi:hypothetical protein ACIPZG_20105 [Pseudomonas sp. NPDC089395]|uniref:hypothetical protein n=1 Tax=Pseudomonas sp. NPDC089395 TaxID=3364460 RepID=UPI00381CFF23
MFHPEVAHLNFTPEQRQALTSASQAITRSGGPEAKGATIQARSLAERLKRMLSVEQQAILEHFAEGRLCALLFTQMQGCDDDPVPERLPELPALAGNHHCQYLASRNPLLLELVRHRAFAFDIDNEGRQVRLVGNFKGGGCVPKPEEIAGAEVETSSHAGLRLGPPTEAPYNCSTLAHTGHSPAPSALILTARWNPAEEPTYVFPVQDILERLNYLDVLALTSASFDFTRSECFADGYGSAGKAISMLQFEANGGFSLRYNSYRFSLNDHASSAASRAFDNFQQAVNDTQPLTFILQPACALLINNSRALHGRDRVRDNRRLLVRQFGYSPFATPLVLAEDPLLVRG